MDRIRVSLSVLALAGVIFAPGCAENNQQASLRGPGKELAKQWAKAAKEPIEADSATPGPEPKLLPMTHFSAGDLFEKQGNYGQAIEQYRKAIEMNATFVAAHSRLGLCYTKVGQYGLAVQALKRAADLQPATPQLWNNLGFAYMAQENYAQAEQCLGKALLAKPGFARAQLNMAITLVQLKRDSEALSHLLAFASAPIAHYDLGTLQLAAGRPSQAHASFEKALALQVDFPAAQKGLEQSLVRLSKEPPTSAAPTAPAVQEQAAVAPAAQDPVVVTREGAAAPATIEKGPVQAESLEASAAPATRPIEGIDDEPAIAKAATWYEPPAQPVCADVARDVAVFRPSLDQFALVRPVVFTDDAGLPLQWMMGSGSAGQGSSQIVVEDEPSYAAMIEAIVCQATMRMAPTPTSVADVDLASLRWAAWTDAVSYLRVDVSTLSNEGLRTVLSKWLCAVNELETLTPIVYGATAYADDM